MASAPTNESDTFDIGGELTVSRLGFGAMRLTGDAIIGPPADEEEAKDVVRRAVDLGVDLIDTADSYGPGVSERLLGEVLAGGDDREDDANGTDSDVVVATKAGTLRNREGDWLPHGDPDYLKNQVLCSLDRLRTNRIDLYQLHTPDPDVDFAESVHAFAEMKDAGQIAHVGLSNVTVEQLETAMDIVDIATVQNQYNVGDREHEDVLQACEDHDVGFIPYGPLYTVDEDGVAGVLQDVAERHDATPRQIALAWLLAYSDVTLPIPGTSSADHLASNVAASQVELTDEDMAALNDVA
ncbi:putative oxidoreductase, aryl-alcohol dehydrogenase like protein [Halovivax ruber XH-70]|uniref:Putative oxidoreductase, aryl-alcohol dehydrogenase like protein n=1 Tax=Halovivax ruber (strain DSM 18193 / JCM 13892 / XH-70) TaxID=797302 RepID=L0I822_HALRX|nr:aldo/keto reductase [Halovivax ruber]AGB14943.1 putative oxidoreductase, aryl-alcohol dehydrogenase like protein [Halovivax ruber XH-70]